MLKQFNIEDDVFYFIDIFCGNGGVTTGLHNSIVNNKRIAKVIACINHDPKAIKNHYLNHPDTVHYTEDIRTLDISSIIEQVKEIRRINPNAMICVWASPDCTHHSKAKGGGPRNADSRTLAEHLYRYVEGINPCMLFVENVEEFMLWGPLDLTGRPVNNGASFSAWVNHIKSYGYDYDYRLLNSADLGAYTSRKRFFGLFVKDGMPLVFPAPTYCKSPGKEHAGLKKWKPVKEVLDFSDEGVSIFGRKKDLVPKTIDRISQGLIKHVIGGKEVFEKAYANGKGLRKHNTIEELKDLFSGDFNYEPMGPNYWLDKQYSGNDNHQSIDAPAGTIMVNDKHVLMKAEHFVARQFSGGGQSSSVDSPAGSLTTVPKMQLVSAKWIMNTNYNNVGSSINEPAPSLLASRRHYYIMNPQWFGTCQSINKPCPTIIARQDKSPLYLITTKHAHVIIGVYKDDIKEMVKLKEIMALYNIVDIKMRMLKIPELLKIQGFPDGYKMFGTQNDQKKFIGNSVTPIVPEKWLETIYTFLEGRKKTELNYA